MGRIKKESFFWTSYSDLMTSLFFVMMVLFILTVAMLHNRIEVLSIDSARLKKGEEIEQSIKKIDQTFFEYNSEYKRHTLKGINVSFRSGSANIYDLNPADLQALSEAGNKIRQFLEDARNDIPGAEYMIIIEGQSSRDDYDENDIANNDVLSYRRARALYKYWTQGCQISFENLPCEVIISGSGQSSSFRNQPDDKFNTSNQRFVIHIIPKPGALQEAS